MTTQTSFHSLLLLATAALLLGTTEANAGRRAYGVSGDRGSAVATRRGVAWSGEHSSGAVTRRGAAVATDDGFAAAGRRGAVVAGNDGFAAAGRRGAVVAGDNGVAVARRPVAPVVRPLPRGYIATVPVGYRRIVYRGYNCYFVGGIYYRAVMYEAPRSMLS